MNTNTALGRSVKTLLWVAISAALVGVFSYVTGHHELFNPTVVGGANVLLVLAKNLQDQEVKNW